MARPLRGLIHSRDALMQPHGVMRHGCPPRIDSNIEQPALLAVSRDFLHVGGHGGAPIGESVQLLVEQHLTAVVLDVSGAVSAADLVALSNCSAVKSLEVKGTEGLGAPQLKSWAKAIYRMNGLEELTLHFTGLDADCCNSLSRSVGALSPVHGLTIVNDNEHALPERLVAAMKRMQFLERTTILTARTGRPVLSHASVALQVSPPREGHKRRRVEAPSRGSMAMPRMPLAEYSPLASPQLYDLIDSIDDAERAGGVTECQQLFSDPNDSTILDLTGRESSVRRTGFIDRPAGQALIVFTNGVEIDVPRRRVSGPRRSRGVDLTQQALAALVELAKSPHRRVHENALVTAINTSAQRPLDYLRTKVTECNRVLTSVAAETNPAEPIAMNGLGEYRLNWQLA